MTKLYIFDLDGTLANIDHRLPFIHKKPKDWKSFLSSTNQDTPIKWTIDLLNVLTLKGEILVLTGREEVTKEETRRWLIEHEIIYDYLVMRSKGDYRADTVTKPELLEKFLRDKDYQVQFIIEDRQKVVDKWREIGYNVLQCNKWEEQKPHGKV